MIRILGILIAFSAQFFRSRCDLLLENLALPSSAKIQTARAWRFLTDKRFQ
jgi:hypothetical protein